MICWWTREGLRRLSSACVTTRRSVNKKPTGEAGSLRTIEGYVLYPEVVVWCERGNRRPLVPNACSHSVRVLLPKLLANACPLKGRMWIERFAGRRVEALGRLAATPGAGPSGSGGGYPQPTAEEQGRYDAFCVSYTRLRGRGNGRGDAGCLERKLRSSRRVSDASARDSDASPCACLRPITPGGAFAVGDQPPASCVCHGNAYRGRR